jgi:hypothetical protein|eukprot:COSAG01_NODE_3026_length_6693_cov_4.993036_10_plen_68_part_00
MPSLQDGLITKDEVLRCATVAFGETPEAAEARWSTMLADMDTNAGALARAATIREPAADARAQLDLI